MKKVSKRIKKVKASPLEKSRGEAQPSKSFMRHRRYDRTNKNYGIVSEGFKVNRQSYKTAY